MPFLKALLIAFTVGLDVFAVSVGVGMRGAPRAVKIRLGIAFATAEVMMNLAGVGLGHLAGEVFGDAAGYAGFAVLIGIGGYIMWEARKESERKRPLDMTKGWGLILASFSIGLDEIGVGFSVPFIGVPLPITLSFIFVGSILATVSGLALGHALGRRTEERAEFWAGLLLSLTGLGFMLAKIFHIG